MYIYIYIDFVDNEVYMYICHQALPNEPLNKFKLFKK